MRHQSHLPRKVIAVDLDEVLARTTLAIADFHNDTYGTTLTMDDFISYDYTKIWGGTREESIAKWRLFFDSPYFLKVEPVEGSLETLKLLKARRFSLVIVTARQQFVADLTKKFVDRHFPGIFESIYFANHFLTEQEKLTFVSKPKSVICRDVHAQLLIDDSLENALEVSKAGIPVLLFDLHGKYKWNQLEEGQQLPEKVTRVKSWKDVQAWFPRPRSPLSNQCLSRDDQISESSSSESEEEEDEDDEEEEEMEEDEGQQVYGYSHHQHHHQQQHHLHNTMDSDSDSDEDDEVEMDEDEMNELAKREQDGEEEEEDHGRTLRRRKLMMMDFSSSSDDDEDIDLESGRHHHHGNMDSNEHDLDLESGHRGRHISHADLERYRHQHETMYMEEPGTEMDMESDSSSYLQQEDDMERGFISTTTTTATATMTATNITTQVSIATVEASTVSVDSQSSTISTLPPAASTEATMAVEGLTIKSPPSSTPETFAVTATSLANRTDSMEDVPLA
ncbi:hypothetical protein BGZ96_009872 [Linnemannia gamsii]|uniref:FCP1 homology domain-containing protein n=1 Tax=Linnemannia gamsii TaxID=64522 RepID=A0ABQ7JW85_9FUNG|nr:hypothetical protein BGZ96_009872 [Linnemannia gamsii]